jgi:indolepyruvate ferredoxin oxidoreductase
VLSLGAAVQIGAIPLEPASLERAIELNGVAVEQNIAAFRFGRQWALAPDLVEATADVQAPRFESLDQMIDRLADDLTDYQNAAYAARFRRLVGAARSAERSVAADSTALTDAVARHFHKLMAYKDEYEVARLALLDESQQRYRAVGGPDTDVTYHLHPPMLRAVGMDRKIKFGRTGEPSFKALRAMKKLRGTIADPFGRAEMRKVERAMVPEYERSISTVLQRLDSHNLDDAVVIASLPDQVRGYEDIKLRTGRATGIVHTILTKADSMLRGRQIPVEWSHASRR